MKKTEWNEIKKEFFDWYNHSVFEGEDVLTFFKAKFSQREKNILIGLRKLRANIPLTQGKTAREMAKELIEYIENETKKT